jgi:dimethylhistidine N-methyltransferase
VPRQTESTALLDVAPSHRRFLRDVRRGLSQTPKRLPSKYFYDARGSRLFDEICLLPEYYPTRTELQIMEHSVDAMAECIGPQATLIEYGSGSSLKTRLLLDALVDPYAYLPVDISREHLQRAARAIADDYPDLVVRPIAADFTREFKLPAQIAHVPHRMIYFPGSTLGNFTPRQALELLERIRRQCGADGGLLLGIDLVKDREVLRAAYNDAADVTARFNLNLLRRINRELGGDFDLEAFAHRAIWNEDKSRIEMHLVSRCRQIVTIYGRQFTFSKGETICTEYSHKYTRENLEQMAARSRFDVREVWSDADGWFGVAYLSAD